MYYILLGVDLLDSHSCDIHLLRLSLQSDTFWQRYLLLKVSTFFFNHTSVLSWVCGKLLPHTRLTESQFGRNDNVTEHHTIV